MKSLYQLIAVMLLSFMASCGKFSDGTSLYAEGLWAIPTVTFIMSIVFAFLTYKASKSGSTQQFKDGTHEFKENVPFWKVNYFYFSAFFLLATIGIMIWINAEK